MAVTRWIMLLMMLLMVDNKERLKVERLFFFLVFLFTPFSSLDGFLFGGRRSLPL